ncbi:MAG: S8 family serine peptidase [Massilibacteroides sp.]|nr:S8 family serine peptidase [Massilibacteroides sp.]MDD3062080.1 S8 family serine peptidase [Massilibacteroides sp.]MDD4114096.1 S8 family serine peptidase [Massilibacteroides sp.]MDD4659624.1 S8 family serine peptidase [Massilibacteroides sp.]
MGRMICVRFLLVGLLCCLPDFFVGHVSAEEVFRFRVYLKDKGISAFSLDEPSFFLSQKAIDRRLKQNIAITEADLPISQLYLDSFLTIGAKPVVQSRWLSTVVVESNDSLIVDNLNQLSIVDSVKWVWKGKISGGVNEVHEKDTSFFVARDKLLEEPYGYAYNQIKMLNGIKLHNNGFRGKGMTVAVIDAGFQHVDRIRAFDKLNLLGTRNFVVPGESIFEGDDHGTKVLSCLAANAEGLMIGTAPEASYWLIKSEDGRSEFPVEEDYWAAAVEFADSVGVDVISSSLGYFSYDVEGMDYPQDALDGNTALISRVACLASEKGLLLFCSAGNEGNGRWEKITFPSDAPGILTVGSVTPDKKRSVFSSVGFTSDYRVKPDMVALGTGSCVIDPSGNIRYANGTSFATPILAGLGVCLWQALPWLSNAEIIELLRESSSQYKRPDAELGYGIPDVYKAYKKENAHVSLSR